MIVCIKDWIGELKFLLNRYGISKVKTVISGGETGHTSIYFGLKAMQEFAEDKDIVLIHDGVRPLINGELITSNIEAVKKYGSAITCEPARESTIRSVDGENIIEVPLRAQMYTAKAPQSFYYGNIFRLYEKAHQDGIRSIDSSHLCSIYNEPMHIVLSTKNNMKITEPSDYYICKALYDALENQQIFGI